MHRRRAWKRTTKVWGTRLTKVVATAAIGAMLGFLIPTFIADYSPKPDAEARQVAESPVARRFIDAYVANDIATLDALGARADDKLQSARFRAEFQRVDPPVHLGSWIGGGFSLHAYASHTIDGQGNPGLRSWRVLTSGGNALVLPPPTEAQQP